MALMSHSCAAAQKVRSQAGGKVIFGKIIFGLAFSGAGQGVWIAGDMQKAAHLP